MFRFLIAGLYISCLTFPLLAIEPASLKNPAAIEELKTGKRSDANAAWWGFDAEDSTTAIQNALNSGAKRVVIPHVGQDWIVHPLTLAGNQELILEPGVNIVAKRGEFRGGGDTLMTARDLENLTIKGTGATLRMQKEDYIVGIVLKNLNWNRWYGQYVKAEWRSTLAIRGCKNVSVDGLTLKDSGGDGVYIDGGRNGVHCQNIRLSNLNCDNHYRQGISIIDVDGLLVENCQFNNTWGTPPSSGVDIEPDSPKHVVKHLVFRDCKFLDNYGDGIEIFLAHMTRASGEVSMLFENCHVSSRRGPGIRVTKIWDNGPTGTIEFRNCRVENTVAYGIKVQDKSQAAARVRFVNCRLSNTANDRAYQDIWAPIGLQVRDAHVTENFGGIDFDNCRVDDDLSRPVIQFQGKSKLSDVTGMIQVRNPHGVKTDWGPQPASFPLRIVTVTP